MSEKHEIHQRFDALMDASLRTDAEKDFEDLGIVDHDGMRELALTWGHGVAAGIAERSGEGMTQIDLAEHLGAAFIGGIFLGLRYAQEYGIPEN